jgi:hypothetical protein
MLTASPCYHVGVDVHQIELIEEPCVWRSKPLKTRSTR